MVGLLWKDIYYIKKMWKTLLFMSAFLLVMILIKEKDFAVTLIIMVLAIQFSILPFRYDNYSKWSEYQYTFPVSKKTVVCSRYLYGLIVFGVCVLLHIFYLFITAQKVEQQYYGLLSAWIICFIPITQAILFPFLYRFGEEKGKLYAIPVFVMIVAIIVECSSLLTNIVSGNSVVLVIAVTGIFVAIYYIFSLSLSIKIENKKIQ